MEQVTIEGVIVTPLKQIYNPRGDVWHAMKCSDPGFDGFGEAYFQRFIIRIPNLGKNILG